MKEKISMSTLVPSSSSDPFIVRKMVISIFWKIKCSHSTRMHVWSFLLFLFVFVPHIKLVNCPSGHCSYPDFHSLMTCLSPKSLALLESDDDAFFHVSFWEFLKSAVSLWEISHKVRILETVSLHSNLASLTSWLYLGHPTAICLCVLGRDKFFQKNVRPKTGCI